MIDVLLSGRLRGTPSVRTGANGAPFALFRVSAADKTGESLLCSCIAFSASAIEAVQGRRNVRQGCADQLGRDVGFGHAVGNRSDWVRGL